MQSMIIDGYCTLGNERETALTAADLLAQMEKANVDKAVIAPEDRELAVFNAAGNDRILQIAAEHNGSFIPSCGINPWHGAGAIAELNRCVERGARMLVLAPQLQGFIPTDELCDDMLTRASELKIPVYVHTGPQSCGGPSQVVLVAERHAATNFIVGHCGSTDHAWDMSTILKHHRLPNLWFELSLVRPWVSPLYIELAGSARFIWASGSPRNCAKFELEQLGKYLDLSRYPDILGENLNQLLDCARPNQ